MELDPNQPQNLKSALKYINRQLAGRTVEGIPENRYLPYDLQFLYDIVQSNSIEKVVIFFQDSESFSDILLIELIDVFM